MGKKSKSAKQRESMSGMLGFGLRVTLSGSHFGFQGMGYEQLARIPGRIISFESEHACWVVEYGPGDGTRGPYHHPSHGLRDHYHARAHENDLTAQCHDTVCGYAVLPRLTLFHNANPYSMMYAHGGT
jgi:hypothetical protein